MNNSHTTYNSAHWSDTIQKMFNFDKDDDLAPFSYLGKGKLSETNGQ